MKTIFLILAVCFMVETVHAVQPSRKPFLQIKIDGASCKNGSILPVTSGQKLMISVEMEGGRKDFCKFPDTYADIAGKAEILSRGNTGLTYESDGVRAEWKLLNENFLFSGDEFVKVNSQVNQPTAEVIISNTKFSQSFIRISVKAVWQFSRDGKITEEENSAESTIYFQIAGTSNVWFSSHNVQAGGMKNELMLEKLNMVQAQFDSTENDFYKLNFSAVQQSFRDLQVAIALVKTTMDEIKTSNNAYEANVVFIGLPSDKPYNDITLLSTVKTNWTESETLVQELKDQLGKLSDQDSKENKAELVSVIGKYLDWQEKLPENSCTTLKRYMPDLNPESCKIPDHLKIKTISDYKQSFNDLKAFVDQRSVQIPLENQKINSTQSRLQAVRLFDGMFRSYFSSINWAEWKNIRE